MSARWVILAISLATPLALGCGQSMQDHVRVRGASDLKCPQELVTPWILDPGRYLVSGCGRQKEYSCRLEAAGPACSGLGAQTLAPARAPGTTGVTEGAQADLALSALSSKVLACRRGATEITVPFEAMQSMDSSGITSGDAKLTDAEAECVVAPLRPLAGSALVHKGGLQGSIVVDCPYCTYTFAAVAPLIAVEAPAPRQVAPTAAPVDVVTARVETAVRSLIDANAATIAACVGKGPTAVEASYAVDGGVQLALRGDQHGTPVERCVVAALPNLHVATEGRAGTVVHLVR